MKMLLIFLLMTDAEAAARAKQIWSNAGFVKHAGKNFMVGCHASNGKDNMWTSKESFEDAFGQVNMKINGPHTVGASARDAAGNVGNAPERVEYLCNK